MNRWMPRYGIPLLVAVLAFLLGLALSQAYALSQHLAADHLALHTVDSAVGRLMTHHPEILAEWRKAMGVSEDSAQPTPSSPPEPSSEPVPE